MLNRLDFSGREELFGEHWSLMWGMRHRIAHGYLLVEPDMIRRTLDTDIPDIVKRIQQALAKT